MPTKTAAKKVTKKTVVKVAAPAPYPDLRPLASMRLSPKKSGALYFLLAGVRGPDRSTAFLGAAKQIVTSRVRGILFKEGACRGGYTRAILSVGHMNDVRRLVAEYLAGKGAAASPPNYAVGVPHYLHHLSDSVEATVRHPIWGGFGTELVTLLKHT